MATVGALVIIPPTAGLKRPMRANSYRAARRPLKGGRVLANAAQAWRRREAGAIF